jgi:hypothetical protein
MYGKFSRSFTLPDNAEVSSVRAESKDGVITVHVNKIKTEPKKADPDQGPVATTWRRRARGDELATVLAGLEEGAVCHRLPE